MSFDDKYKTEVLEPARAAGDQPPEDLRLRYALPDPLTAAGVTAQVKQVRQCWRRTRGQLKYRKLIDRLEADHRELTPVFTAAESGDLGPLKQRLRGGDERNARRRAEVRHRLLDAAGPLKVLSPSECEAIGRAGGISAAELSQLLRIDGLEVHEPDSLPMSAPYAGYQKAYESLQVLGSRHLLAFLLGSDRIGGIRVFGGISAGGVRIDPAGAERALERVSGEWARRPRDTSATHAETVLIGLRTAMREGFLHDLLGHDLVYRLRERKAQRASDNALMDFAVRGLGLEPAEARRLVFSIGREGSLTAGPAARLRELLDAGSAHAASLLADTITDPEAAAEVAEAGQRVAAAARLLDEALALTGDGDLDEAWLRLSDALQLASDLPGAREHQRRLPPLPPSSVQASADGPSVRIVWTDSPSRAGEIAHEVVRRVGRAPFDSADGTLVSGGFDDTPPVNVPLYYAVYARRGEATSSPVACGPVVVRPEPSHIDLASGDGTVTGRWDCPAEAARVAVYRDGRPISTRREGFTDHAVTNGVTHRYRVAAVYLDGTEEIETAGVVMSITPHAPPDPVVAFAMEPHSRERLLLRFEPPENGLVEAWLLDREPQWAAGAVIPHADLIGRRVEAAPHTHGLVVRPGASGILLLVTISGESAAVGASRRHVDLPAPSGLVATRRGAEVHLGFGWPGDAAAVAVTYEIGDEGAKRVSVSRAAYMAEGGVHLPVPESEPVKVSVSGTTEQEGSVLTGPPVTAKVAARPLVRYDVEPSGPLWRRVLLLKLTPDKPVTLSRLDLVLRDGRVMPQRPSDGETLVSWQDFELKAETTLRVPMPKRNGAYWLRCFASAEAELADPPVRRLQQGNR